MTEKREFLEIHHISVSKGDATVIAVNTFNNGAMVNSDLTLIDVGTTTADIKRIETHLNKAFKKYNVKSIIVSHNHEDHKGYLFTYTHSLFGPETVVYRGGHCKSSDFLNGAKLPKKLIEIIINKEPYKLKIHDSISFICYCASGQLPGKVISIDENENNYSLAWVLEYKEFRYFTAGDLSGYTTQQYTNMEGPLLGYLYNKYSGPLKDKTINVLKASHHGSMYNMFGYDNVDNNEKNEKNNSPENNGKSFFLEKLKPETIILTCHGSDLPTQEFFLRVDACKEIKYLCVVNNFDRSAKKGIDYMLEINKSWNDNKKSNIAFPDTITYPDTNEKNKNYSNAFISEVTKAIGDENKTENVKVKRYPVGIVFVDTEGAYKLIDKGGNLFEVDLGKIPEKKGKTQSLSKCLPDALDKYLFCTEKKENKTPFQAVLDIILPDDQELKNGILNLYKYQGISWMLNKDTSETALLIRYIEISKEYGLVKAFQDFKRYGKKENLLNNIRNIHKRKRKDISEPESSEEDNNRTYKKHKKNIKNIKK